MLPLEVVTTDISGTNRTRTKVIDHDDPGHRVWLGKHCFWAFRNGHSIKTTPMPEGTRITHVNMVKEEKKND